MFPSFIWSKCSAGESWAGPQIRFRHRHLISDSSLIQYSTTDPKDSTGSVCKTPNFLSDFFFFFLLLNSHTPNSLCPRQHSPVVALSTDVRSSREKVLKDQKTPQKLVQRNTTPVCCGDNAEKSSLNLLKIKQRHFNYPQQIPSS